MTLIGRTEISSSFPLKKVAINSKVSDKITKLPNTLIILTNSNDIIITPFIIKEGTEAIYNLGSAILY